LCAEVIDTPLGFWKTICYVMKIALIPHWLSSWLGVRIALPLITYFRACLWEIPRARFRQLIVWLRYGFAYNPARKRYSRSVFEPSTSPLLGLPLEIRLLIWQELLGRQEKVYLGVDPSTKYHLLAIDPPPT